jgi:glycosyltransferase involved in cell wall biosynthesis/peptidoglycan/xylan/chitin deacetylase (PgdA/CDA1 family)
VAHAVEDSRMSQASARRASPRVSVIVPAFNAKTTLPRALDSLVRQSLTDWEAVVVDDGSSDDTLELARHRAEQDPRIRVLAQGNDGASAARNAGIADARAPWLVFLDADDWVAPEHLERLLAVVETHRAQVGCCGYARVTSDGGTIATGSCTDLAERPLDVLAQRSAGAIHAFIVRRDLVMNVGAFDTTLTTCEDWDLWQRIARTGARFVAISATLAYYRTMPASLSGGRQRMVQDAVRVIERGTDPEERQQESAALFAVWCAAAEAARGTDAAGLLDEIPRLPDLTPRLDDLVASIRGGMIVGGQLLQGDVATAWPRVYEQLAPTLVSLDEAASSTGLAFRVRTTLERRILADDTLHEPIVLTTWMGARADLRERITGIEPPRGVEGLDYRIHAGDALLAKLEVPAFGAIPASSLAGTVVDTLGWRAVVRHGRLLRRARFWFALLINGARAVPAFAGAVASLARGKRTGVRRLAGDVLRAATRSAITASQPPPSVEASDSRAAAFMAEERAFLEARSHFGPGAGLEPAPQPDPDSPDTIDRKTYWEKTFEVADPWTYDSEYETRKYAQTLSLLEGGPVRKALELGCAEGIFTRRLAPRVGQLVAADISDRALERARERCRAEPNVDFQQIDFFDDAIPGGMDVIVCSEVLYFCGNRWQLKKVAEKIVAALAPRGRLLTAHALLLADDPSRTGFDWDQPFGATTIGEAFQAAGLTLEKSIHTELYRVDLFRKNGALDEVVEPVSTIEPFGTPLDPDVERGIVWGGAVVRRADIASIDTIQVPVLLYHRVADDGPPALSDDRVTPQRFEEQMRFLRRHGFHTVTSADLEQHRRERRPMQGRPVLITFDDGYRDFFDVAWPILRRVGFTAEVFLPTDLVGGQAEWDRAHGNPAPLMSWEEIGLAYAQGVRFGSHLATHTHVSAMSAEALLREGVRSRETLERRLGGEVRAVAPPYGACDERGRRILQACGFTQILTSDGAPAALDGSSATVSRIAVSGRDTIEDFAARLGMSAVDPHAADLPLVTVVVPAYNAEKTIDETLRSVRAQTYRRLEILVVDDGSTDRTAARVVAHARTDPRVRLIQQLNAGVAAARNRGIAEADADFIAPIDADDVWMPTKIEKQMAAMLSRGPRCGLVYTWQNTIDERGQVIAPRRRWDVEGYVLPRMLFGNLVGGGSPALMRRHAIVEAGGYDSSLRERGAQGCEDCKLYLQISERYEFAVIREFLTGYRLLPQAMSMDVLQMIRSHDLVAAYAEQAHPHHARLIRSGQIFFRQMQLRTAVRQGQMRTAAIVLLDLLRNYPWHACKLLLDSPRLAIRLAMRNAKAHAVVTSK